MVEAMRTLLLSKGFAATTVDEVCEQAAVTKGGFYHHFSSKDAMGLAAIDSYFDDLVTALSDGPFASIGDPVDRVLGFVDHVAEVCRGPIVRNGCVLGVFALEVAERDESIQLALADRFRSMAVMISTLIAAAAAEREVDVDADLLADHLLTVIEGAIVLAKAHGDPAMISRQVDLFGDYLSLLLEGRTPR